MYCIIFKYEKVSKSGSGVFYILPMDQREGPPLISLASLSFCNGYRILVLYTMQNHSFLQGDSYEYCDSFEVNLYIFKTEDRGNMSLLLLLFLSFLSQDNNQIFSLGYDSSGFLFSPS